jgi:hypothetical protein
MYYEDLTLSEDAQTLFDYLQEAGEPDTVITDDDYDELDRRHEWDRIQVRLALEELLDKGYAIQQPVVYILTNPMKVEI